jgi:hypothetical protein
MIGNLYLDSGDLAKAEPFIKLANSTSSLGRLHLAKADYPSAKNSYERLLKSAEQNRNANNLFTAYAGLGMSYEGMGDNPQWWTVTERLLHTLKTSDRASTLLSERLSSM